MTTATETGAKPVAATYSCFDDLYAKYGPLMRTDAVADLLHCHKSHVRAMCQAGELPAVRVGSRWFMPTAKMAAICDGAGEANDR